MIERLALRSERAELTHETGHQEAGQKIDRHREGDPLRFRRIAEDLCAVGRGEGVRDRHEDRRTERAGAPEAEAAGDHEEDADDVRRPVGVIGEEKDRVRDDEQIDGEDELRDLRGMADEALRAKQHSDESRLREQQRAEEDDMLNTDVREEGTERERDHRAADARPVERAFELDELVGGDRRRCHYAVSAASAARARSGSSKRSASPFRCVAGRTRYATTRAAMFGSMSRPSRCICRNSSARGKSAVESRRMRSCISVSRWPGSYAVTVTPVPSSSSASARVSCTTPAFAAPYAESPALGRVDWPEEMFTMRPLPRSSIPGSTMRIGRYVPPTLIEMLRSQSAGSDRASWTTGSIMPAAFTRIVAGPTHRSVASTRSWTWRSSETSAVCARA